MRIFVTALAAYLACGIRVLKHRVPEKPALVEVNATIFPRPSKFPAPNKGHAYHGSTGIWGSKRLQHPHGFDNYQSGKIGGIVEICVATATRHGGKEVGGIRVDFAGETVHMGITTGARCWSPYQGDPITTIEVWDGDRVGGLRVKSKSGRTSPLWGNTNGLNHRTWTSPRRSGDHLVGFYGQTEGSKQSIHRLGFFVGKSGGKGFWTVAHQCGSVPCNYNVKTCTSQSESQSVTNFNSWTKGVTTEFSAGFAIDGASFGVTDTVSESETNSHTNAISTSFNFKRCVQKPFGCEARETIWVWQYRITLGGRSATIPTNHIECGTKREWPKCPT